VARYFTGTDNLKEIFFKMADPSMVEPGAIEITRTIKSQTMNSVEFVREKSSIRVTSDFSGGPKFLASPSLSTDGHCVAIVDGCELELWNVRRKALDELFFGAV